MTTDPSQVDIPATLTAIGAIITAIGVILIAYWSYRGKQKATDAAESAAKIDRKLIEIGDKVYALDERVDGRLSELLKTNREKAEAQIAAAHASGKAEGEQAQRDRASGPT